MRIGMVSIVIGLVCACAAPTEDSVAGGGDGPSGTSGSSGDGGEPGSTLKPGQGGGSGAGASCDHDADCGAGHVCDIATGTCTPGGECGAEEFALEAREASLFIALDRSCSMQGGTPSKWSSAVTAVQNLVAKFKTKIRFGIALFPDLDKDSCSQKDGKTLVPIAADTQQAITNVLYLPLAQPGIYGACDTNIDAAIAQIAAQQELAQAEAGYGLLLTDGKQNDCSSAGGIPGAISTLEQLKSQNIKTFIVGFKNGVDPTAMNALALAGGMAKSGTEKYYHADDGTELEAALGSIGKTIVDCSFTLGSTPDDPDLLYAFLNDQPVDRDPQHLDGWDYDPASNSVEFYGSACDALKSGQVSDVDVVFGCNQASPH